MPSRLSRLDCVYTDQIFYFLTFCTHERKPLLATPIVHESFRQFAVAATTQNIFVGRYVIMPDHLHLFAAFSQQSHLSPWVKALKGTLAKSLRDSGHKPPHWQKGFHDHLLRNEESYGSKWEYVFQNPIRHSLVSDPTLWPFQGEINPLSFH